MLRNPRQDGTMKIFSWHHPDLNLFEHLTSSLAVRVLKAPFAWRGRKQSTGSTGVLDHCSPTRNPEHPQQGPRMCMRLDASVATYLMVQHLHRQQQPQAYRTEMLRLPLMKDILRPQAMVDDPFSVTP